MKSTRPDERPLGAGRGRVVVTGEASLPFRFLDAWDQPIAAVDDFVRELRANGNSPATCRSYCYDLLDWFRFLQAADTSWDRATRQDVRDYVLSILAADNPQRRRRRPDTPPPGSMNATTGKRYLALVGLYRWRGCPSHGKLSLLQKLEGRAMSDTQIDLEGIEAERQRIRQAYLQDPHQRPAASARGVHHLALLSSDVERTVRFYQELLEFPLTEIFENRDYKGSNHFFFDIGNGNLLAFFDFPGLDLGPYAEVLGGLHHVAISVEPQRWNHLKAKLDKSGIPYQLEGGTSLYFRDPDGARLELIADRLGEMYGKPVR